MTSPLDRTSIDAVLLDIEGTTTPIAFVHETLFGFARSRLHGFLERQAARTDVAEALERLRAERRDDPEASDLPQDDVEAYVLRLIDRDRKSPGLKALQGFIWEEGYRSGALVSEVYPDVPPAIRKWRAAGLKVAIYSSGSVLAQRLLFSHTGEGDLAGLFDAFFDTGVGAKTSSESYRAIARRLGTTPERILFVSDATGEIDAARSAGCRVGLCVRPGTTFDRIAAT